MLPRSLYLSRVAKAVLPVRAWDRLADRLGVYHSMDAYTGRVQAPTPLTFRISRGRSVRRAACRPGPGGSAHARTWPRA